MCGELLELSEDAGLSARIIEGDPLGKIVQGLPLDRGRRKELGIRDHVVGAKRVEGVLLAGGRAEPSALVGDAPLDVDARCLAPVG